MKTEKKCQHCKKPLHRYYVLWCPRCEKPKEESIVSLNFIKVLTYLTVLRGDEPHIKGSFYDRVWDSFVNNEMFRSNDSYFDLDTKVFLKESEKNSEYLGLCYEGIIEFCKEFNKEYRPGPYTFYVSW